MGALGPWEVIPAEAGIQATSNALFDVVPAEAGIQVSFLARLRDQSGPCPRPRACRGMLRRDDITPVCGNH